MLNFDLELNFENYVSDVEFWFEFWKLSCLLAGPVAASTWYGEAYKCQMFWTFKDELCI